MNTEANSQNYDLTIQNMKRVLENLTEDATYSKPCQDLLLLMAEPEKNADAIIKGISALRLQDNHHLQWGSWLLKAKQADWDLTGRPLFARNAFALYVLDPGKLYSGRAFANEAAEHIRALTGHVITKELHKTFIAFFHSQSGRDVVRWVSDLEGRGKIYSGAQILNRIKCPESWFFIGKAAYERVTNGEVGFLYATMKPEYIPQEFQSQGDALNNDVITQMVSETQSVMVDESSKSQEPMFQQELSQDELKLKPKEEAIEKEHLSSFHRGFAQKVPKSYALQLCLILLLCVSASGAFKFSFFHEIQKYGAAEVKDSAQVTYDSFADIEITNENVSEFYGAAWILNRNGYFSIGTEAAERILSDPKELRRYQPDAHYLYGDATKKMGRFLFAYRQFIITEELLINAGRPTLGAVTEQAFTAYLLGNFNEAWLAIERGETLEASSSQKARFLLIKSFVLLNLKRQKEALSAAQNSFELYFSTAHHDGMADAYSNIGLCFYAMGNYAEGDRYTALAKKNAEALNSEVKLLANQINFVLSDRSFNSDHIRQKARELKQPWIEARLDNILLIR